MRLIHFVADLLLDCISLLVRDDTPAIVVTTFEELNRVLSGNKLVAHQPEDRPHQFDICVDPLSAEVGLFEIRQCLHSGSVGQPERKWMRTDMLGHPLS